jgi:hypothetical protein
MTGTRARAGLGCAFVEIGDVIPPDDNGRDAFSRFRYQAHAIFPACLKCATANGPTAVICEHIEDVCIEGRPLRPPSDQNPQPRLRWVAPDRPVRIERRHAQHCPSAPSNQGHRRRPRVIYEIQLEGFLARGDLIRNLARGEPAPDDEVAKAVVRAFKKDTDKLALTEARGIVSRLVVFTAQRREVIVAANHRLLAALAGHLPANELSEIYDRVVELICKAMEGALAGDRWPKVLFAADGGTAEGVDLADKRLDPETLCGPLGPAVTGQLPALAGLTDADLTGATDLVRKLNIAGAPQVLIEQAKNLRAYASRRELELRARDMRGTIDAELEDLDNRLLTAGAISLGLHGSGPAPGPAVFADLMDRLGTQPENHDPRSLFHRDPMLLMGGVCQLSDECRHAWRTDA